MTYRSIGRMRASSCSSRDGADGGGPLGSLRRSAASGAGRRPAPSPLRGLARGWDRFYSMKRPVRRRPRDAEPMPEYLDQLRGSGCSSVLDSEVFDDRADLSGRRTPRGYRESGPVPSLASCVSAVARVEPPGVAQTEPPSARTESPTRAIGRSTSGSCWQAAESP
jgi:hypothetical protein